MVIANHQVSKKKRPIGVWLISIFYLFSCSWTLLSFLLIYLKLAPLTTAQEVYFDNLSVIDYLISIGIGGLGVAGAISLFRLKKIAIKLFSISLALNIVSTIWHLLKTNFAEAIGGTGLVGHTVGIGMMVAVIFYCKRLENKEYLS